MSDFTECLRKISEELQSLKRPSSALVVSRAADELDLRKTTRAVGTAVIAGISMVVGLGIGIGVAILAMPTPAKAHQAPSGWQYPYECCSDHDCYQITRDDIEIVDDGYLIKASRDHQIVPFSRAKASPDGGWHRCSVGGDPEAWTLCLFVPEGS